MPINFASVEAKGRRRVRLTFDNELDWAAFSTSFYSVACTDGAGPSPNVRQALLIQSPTGYERNHLDLALDADLVDGGSYTVSAIGVPATDTSVTSASSTLPLKIGERRKRATEQLGVSDAFLRLAGDDLVFDDGDFAETADGDLAIQGGVQSIVDQATECALSNGLPWAPSHGGKLRSFVDGSTRLLPAAADSVVRAILRDDRIQSATAEVVDGDISVNLSIVGGQFANAKIPFRVGS